MRRTSKASSAGSNSGREVSRPSFRRSGALAAFLIGLLASACFLPGSAFAVEYRTVTESFGPDGTSGSSFGFPTAVGFDQGNKHLYALEGGEIHGFDSSTPATHTPLGGNFPLSTGSAGEFNGIAADPASHNFYYATPEENTLYGYSGSGTALSGFPVSGQNFSCGTAVDSSGDVWVSEANEGKVREYSPAGALVETHTIGGEPCSLAFDAEDNLYAGYYYGPTMKFTAASGYTDSSTIDSEFTSAMTVDKATGEVFVIHYNYINVWDTEGEFLYEFGEPIGGGFSGIAIDESTEEAYVSDYEHGTIQVFSPPAKLAKPTTEGATGITTTEATVHGTVIPNEQALEDCRFEVIPAAQFNASKYTSVTAGEKYPCVPAAGSIPADAEPHAVSAAVTGLTAATAYHYRLVATNAIGEAQGADRAFTTGPTAPLVAEESAEAVGTVEATVAAKINPHGGQTTYHVEYGTTNAYGQSTAESAPLGFPTDNDQHPVSVHIGGLQPGTAYHFRFVATNEAGSAAGTDTSFFTYPTVPPPAACPDETFRTGFGAQLPDCRAYEQGTPIEKHGSNALPKLGSVGASPSGDRFSFLSTGVPTTGGLSQIAPFIASRGPNGWSTDGLIPPTDAGSVAEVRGVNEDLSVALVVSGKPGVFDKQIFLRDSATASFQPGPVIPNATFPNLIGFAGDPSHLAFLSEKQLLPGALANKANLYDLDHGALTLADRVPAGSAIGCDDEAGPACVVPAEGTTYGTQGQTILRDGRVVFTANPAERAFTGGRIYMREDGARTTWISASQRTTPDPGGEKPAELAGVTPDGSKVFFKSCEKLTDDSTAVSTAANSCSGGSYESLQGKDLYSYDVDTGALADLTVDSNAGDPLRANVQQVLGVGDGSYVYFFADGVLAPGGVYTNCLAFQAKCNLYVYHEGVTTLIARTQMDGVQSRVSADGRTLLFRSPQSLTGYDNESLACPTGIDPGPCAEFFRYSTSEEKLLCVSCIPTGTTPRGNAILAYDIAEIFFNGGASPGPSRNVSADGNRVFFESRDALVAGDTNGVADVYEWEAKGTGSCESESQNGGCIYLLSTGTGVQPAHFLDASENGDHVFLTTDQQLVPGDEDQLSDVYDAGVGAGLAAQHELPPPTCSAAACQANPAPPPDQPASSAVFSGPGNAHRRPSVRKCPKGKRKVRRAGKVRCQKAHKQHKRHNNRGGAK